MNFSELGLIQAYPFLDQSPILIDVGAHHGSVSLAFALAGWHVVAFEPEEKNRAVFKRNLAQFSKVTCIPKAVSDRTGDKVPFFVSEEHFGIHTLKPFHPTHKLAYKVETVRLDDTLAELAIHNVTLLKIDIEGVDFLALQSFDFELHKPELIMIEFMDERSQSNFGYTHHDVAKFMKEKGYRTFVSEWAPIKEYGREGVSSEPHVWLQCVPYPLEHSPSWGNLIFVPEDNEAKFIHTLDRYLKFLKREEKLSRLRKRVAKIPGSKSLYRLLKRS